MADNFDVAKAELGAALGPAYEFRVPKLDLGARYYPPDELGSSKLELGVIIKLGTPQEPLQGTILRAKDGIWRVTSVTDANTAVLELIEPPKGVVNETNDKRVQPTNVKQWTLDVPITRMTGLWHLEGETVSILGDGNVFTQAVVTDGLITLPDPVTRAHIGIPYECRAKSLPLSAQQGVIEGKRKRVAALALRLDKSRGLQVGRATDELYPLRERSTERPGYPTKLINGVKYQIISTNWDENGQTYFVQRDPLPVTLLSYVAEVEVGDDPD